MKREKTNEELLISYKRRNKIARERMAINAGFKTGDEYKAYLMGVDTKKTASKKKSKKNDIVIHNVHILDRSTSMSGPRLRAALKGINNDIQELRNDDTLNCKQSIVVFGSTVTTVMWKKPINKVKEYSTRVEGATALNQAVGETLERLVADAKPNEKTIVKVFTDGGENVSRGKYRNSNTVAGIIQVAKELGIMTTFVGTVAEVNYAINNFGINSSNTMVHDNTEIGINRVSESMSMGTKSYSARSMAGETVLDGFYKSTETLD